MHTSMRTNPDGTDVWAFVGMSKRVRVRSSRGWERLLVAASAQRSMPKSPGEHAQHRTHKHCTRTCTHPDGTD
eukprot:6204556-Prymnesium_polylepis.1